MLLLGLGHKARSGKDTVAEAIRGHYEKLNSSYGYTHPESRSIKVGIFKFATALYAEVNEILANRNRTSSLQGDFLEPILRHEGKTIVVPSWVTLDPNPEISALAPLGKHPKLLQWWGTEVRRAQDPDYWVKRTFASIPANLDIALISDVRFVNEAEGVKTRGGHTIDVQRLREDGTQYYSDDRPADHPSETALDGYNFDYYIKVRTGEVKLVQELAITFAQYLKGLQNK